MKAFLFSIFLFFSFGVLAEPAIHSVESMGDEVLINFVDDKPFYIGALSYELKVDGKRYYRTSFHRIGGGNSITFHLTKDEYKKINQSSNLYISYGETQDRVAKSNPLPSVRSKTSSIGASFKKPYSNVKVGSLSEVTK